MNDGFVVICEDDAILFGHGDTAVAAWQDAQKWIREALQMQLQDEIHYAQKGAGRSVCVDLSWTVHSATAALRESLDKRGGHDKWQKRPDGTLDIRQPEIEVGDQS